MDTLTRYVIEALVLISAGYALSWLEPKVKVAWWLAHASIIFPMAQAQEAGAQPALRFRTRAFTVQNVGRRRAEGIQIAHDARPAYLALWPNLVYAEPPNPQGAHIIEVATLGPGEWFTVTVLSIDPTPLPNLMNVRSRDGFAQQMPMVPTRPFSRWARIGYGAAYLSGVGLWLYWVVRLVQLGMRAVGL